ncbi:hypothetical protein [Paraburkholderia tropica]|uniref:hypothetical protein n=1 Tax=Paraburkholderia tropica TaxID=92647 RepID=UPI002AB2C0B0|nr:hypothetical protein [Paraburkholderia tropica]
MPAAQQIPAGSYNGRLAGLPIVLHCAWSDAGQLTLTFDSPDQGANDLACAIVDTPGRTLEFTVPAANASWSGALEADDVTLAGKWTQGIASTLKLVRDTFVASARPSRFDGIWHGITREKHRRIIRHRKIRKRIQTDEVQHRLFSRDLGRAFIFCHFVGACRMVRRSKLRGNHRRPACASVDSNERQFA